MPLSLRTAMKIIFLCLLSSLCCVITSYSHATLVLGKLEKRGAESQVLIIHSNIGIQTISKNYPFTKADTGYKLLALSVDSITIYKPLHVVDTDITEEYYFDHIDDIGYLSVKTFTRNGIGYCHVRIPASVKIYVIPLSQIVAIRYRRKSLENLGCTIGCLILPPVWIYSAIATSHPDRRYSLKKWKLVYEPYISG